MKALPKNPRVPPRDVMLMPQYKVISAHTEDAPGNNDFSCSCRQKQTVPCDMEKSRKINILQVYFSNYIGIRNNFQLPINKTAKLRLAKAATAPCRGAKGREFGGVGKILGWRWGCRIRHCSPSFPARSSMRSQLKRLTAYVLLHSEQSMIGSIEARRSGHCATKQINRRRQLDKKNGRATKRNENGMRKHDHDSRKRSSETNRIKIEVLRLQTRKIRNIGKNIK